MFKKLGFIFFYLLYLVVETQAIENTKIEVTAKFLYTSENTVHASEGVVVYYDGSIIKSEKATYNKETKLLVLDGNIEMIGYLDSKENANHMEIKTDTKEVDFKKLFLASENDVWMLSNKAHRIDGIYNFGRTVLSSCDVSNPLWYMEFSNSTYDNKDKYMKIYNAKISFLDVPIFYTPYLAFSTDKRRSSGLLFPGFGYVKAEGLLYEQPIFWAMSPSVDLEINPQIRLKRSIGVYTTLRFVDSNHSKGKLRVGYFKDKQSYVDEYKLEHSSHYGIEFNYESAKVFKDYLPTEYTDELYINTTYLNDIDYLNLQKNNLNHFGLRSLQESRINYFAYSNNYYTGIYAKYFIDTRQEANDKTLQILPVIQWHKYLKHVVWDNLTYSIDTHINNITRESGATYRQAEIRVPLEYTGSALNDYINFSFTEEVYYSKYIFGNEKYEHDNFQYYNNVHNLKIFTDLTKHYNEYIHVILPSLGYIKTGSESQSPVTFLELEKTQTQFFSVDSNEEVYSFMFTQYIYNKKEKLKFFQRFSQNYFPSRVYKWDNLINEMGYNWKKFEFYNQLIYSNEFNAISTISSEVLLREKEYKFKIGHNYNQILTDEVKEVKTNNIELEVDYEYNEKIRFGAGIVYDLEESTSKQWQIVAGYYKDCWNIDLSLKRDIRPTSRGQENLTSFYFQLNFIPFGGIDSSALDALIYDE